MPRGHILSIRKSLFSILFASNYWYLNANAGRGRLNANKRLRSHKNSKHLNQKSQEQNCQKWPILEVNFKHIRYKSIDGPSSIYRLQNHLDLLCAKNGWKKRFSKVAQFGIYWNLSGKWSTLTQNGWYLGWISEVHFGTFCKGFSAAKW